MNHELHSAELDHLRDALVDERLTLEAFSQLSGNLAGYPFVKVVVDRGDPKNPVIHFINDAKYRFHGDYIAEKILGISRVEFDQNVDQFNQEFYLSPTRRFFLGILSMHSRGERFFSLETVEIDTMSAAMVGFFYGWVRNHVEVAIPILFKPANHFQEEFVRLIDPGILPRVFSHELFASAQFIALNPGSAQGRLRAFRTADEYRASIATLQWHDIIVMHRVPDDIPRVSGIINAHHTTPLSHTNVLASGWQIPNSIQIGIFSKIDREGLNGQWVAYSVDPSNAEVILKKIERPDFSGPPVWSVQTIKLEQPETKNTRIRSLDELRISDRFRYGTKAANLGELRHVLDKGSDKLLGFYKISRPPRAHLLPYISKFLGIGDENASPHFRETLSRAARDYLRENINIPRGIALPFSVQQEFLESSPAIQQAIGKLKMALELNARETDSLCLSLQNLIKTTRIPEKLRGYVDEEIANSLAGVSSFVIRSSSNAEDLENFSAAGIYESVNHARTVDAIFTGIKEVWASLLSPRSVRLRQEVGISLDDSYMGVIIQEEILSGMGGVLVTANPLNRKGDFRNVYINVSQDSISSIVQGTELPLQYLFNVVEGGGRTLSMGSAKEDLSDAQKAILQRLAVSGRLLQSHFSPDYTFAAPVDIEWIANSEGAYILQLRPYSN